jgi:undecaprenyl-diphosphatase
MHILFLVLIFIARWVPWIILGILLVVMGWDYRSKPKKFFEEALAIAVTAFLAWGISGLGKILVHAPRPFVGSGSETIFFVRDMTSFPSGHASALFALAGALYFYHEGAGYIFFCCALLVSAARVAVGVHFPIDVAAGALLGLAVALILHRYIHRFCQDTFFKKNL